MGAAQRVEIAVARPHRRSRIRIVDQGQVRQEKLAKLLAAEGYETLEELAQAVLSDKCSN